jgi:hypothetical protein
MTLANAEKRNDHKQSAKQGRNYSLCKIAVKTIRPPVLLIGNAAALAQQNDGLISA